MTALEQPAILPPLTFRLPKAGETDPHFGFSRAWFYAAEKRGWIRMVRIRQPGKDKGVTLIPYRDVEAFVIAHME